MALFMIAKFMNIKVYKYILYNLPSDGVIAKRSYYLLCFLKFSIIFKAWLDPNYSTDQNGWTVLAAK